MDLEKVAHGQISVERFYGQTYIYIPAAIAETAGGFALTKIVLHYFTKEQLREHEWRIDKGEHQGVSFYMLDLPSVLRPREAEQPEFNKPDSLAQKIQDTYTRKKANTR